MKEIAFVVLIFVLVWIIMPWDAGGMPIPSILSEIINYFKQRNKNKKAKAKEAKSE